MDALKTNLIAAYSEDDVNYPNFALAAIQEYFDKQPKSQSKIDPDRLGPRSTFTSRLKSALIEKVGPIDVDGHPQFNELNVKDQIRFQQRALLTGLEPWVHAVQIVPANLAGLKIPDAMNTRLKAMRASVDNKKLEQEMVEYDASIVLNKLCPFLLDPYAKRHYLAAALLAVTGRRTIEVLKLGRLYLGPGQTPDGYRCWFSGQAKQGVIPTKDYEIPLLAPFHIVNAALTRVRAMYETENVTEERVNSHLSKSIINFVQRSIGTNPHSLRAIYAITTYALSNTKMSLIGHIKLVLGHSDGSSAAYYQRVEVINATVWTPPANAVVPALEEKKDEFDGWIIDGVVEKKRFEGIREMMNSRVLLTATAIRTKVGGTMNVIQRILERNKAKVDAYNASLTEEETKRIRRA